MNKVLFDIMQNAESGYTSTASKAAYKRYATQKAAPLDFDIKINIDEKNIQDELNKIFAACGATIE